MTQTATVPTVEGRLEEKTDDRIVLDIEGTDYKLHLVPQGEIPAAVGDRIAGVVRIQARRVDVVPGGGRYVEPVYGRPRRVQGRITGGDVAQNLLYLNAGAGIMVVRLMPSQKASDFKVGQLASFDAEPGATFEIA